MHVSESDLSVLEQSWAKIQSQTLWTLQECYMPADSQPVISDSNHTSGLNEQNSDNPGTVVADLPITETSLAINAHDISISTAIKKPNVM